MYGIEGEEGAFEYLKDLIVKFGEGEVEVR